jgi:hypothetical protein
LICKYLHYTSNDQVKNHHLWLCILLFHNWFKYTFNFLWSFAVLLDDLCNRHKIYRSHSIISYYHYHTIVNPQSLFLLLIDWLIVSCISAMFIIQMGCLDRDGKVGLTEVYLWPPPYILLVIRSRCKMRQWFYPGPLIQPSQLVTNTFCFWCWYEIQDVVI